MGSRPSILGHKYRRNTNTLAGKCTKKQTHQSRRDEVKRLLSTSRECNVRERTFSGQKRLGQKLNEKRVQCWAGRSLLSTKKHYFSNYVSSLLITMSRGEDIHILEITVSYALVFNELSHGKANSLPLWPRITILPQRATKPGSIRLNATCYQTKRNTSNWE